MKQLKLPSLLVFSALVAICFSSISSAEINDFDFKRSLTKSQDIKTITAPSPVQTRSQIKIIEDNPSGITTQKHSDIPQLPEQDTSITTQVKTPVMPSMPQMSSVTLKGPADIKTPKIKVPTYEKQLKAMLESKEKAETKKRRKKLMDEILDEVANYGIWIILGLIAFILVYTLYKDKEIEGKIAHEHEEMKQVGMPEKKDIWKDEF